MYLGFFDCAKPLMSYAVCRLFASTVCKYVLVRLNVFSSF